MDRLTPSSSLDLSQVLRGQTPEVVGIDARGGVWVVLELDAPPTASAAPAGAPCAGHFRVLRWGDGQLTLDVTVGCPSTALSEVDALGDGFLLAWSRSDVLDDGVWAHNAWVYGGDGQFQRSMMLGDGIEQLRVAADGLIWTSHFDEGCYSGWDGACPLVAWQSSGDLLFGSADRGWIGHDDDVVGLNPAGDGATWFSVHGLLCRAQGHETLQVWNLGMSAGGAYAVQGRDVLVAGPWGPPLNMDTMLVQTCDGSDAGPVERQELARQLAALLQQTGRRVVQGDTRAESPQGLHIRWLRLGDNSGVSVLGDFTLCTADGAPIEPRQVLARSNRLFVLAAECLHVVGVADVAAPRR